MRFPRFVLAAPLALAACGDVPPASEPALRTASLLAPSVAEKDLAIAFHLADASLVRAADRLPSGEVLLPRAVYRKVESAFAGSPAQGALEEENVYDDWQVVSARVAPCSALGPTPTSDVSRLCWPELRLVLQPILYDMTVHARFSPAFADDRAMHVLYDVSPERALSAAEAARARALLHRVRRAEPTVPFAPLSPSELGEFEALRNRAVTRLLHDVLALRDPAFDAAAYGELGLRPESVEGGALQRGLRARFLAFLGAYARPSAIRDLTAFSLPAGREPAHLDEWVFVALRAEGAGASTLAPVDLTLTSATDGATLFDYGRFMVASMSADDPRPASALRGARGSEIQDSVILRLEDIARLGPTLADGAQTLVPNVPCGSCHKLNELRFDFHNFSYLEDRDLTIAPRVRRDVELDLAWLRAWTASLR